MSPKALSVWYAEKLGVRLQGGAEFSLFQWRERDDPARAKVVEEFNGRFAWVIDPDGNKVELWEPKAGY